MNTLRIQRHAPAHLGCVPATVRTLARLSADLRCLYLYAAAVSEPGLRLVLSENARTLELLISDLRAQLHPASARSGIRGSWRWRAHRRLTGWLTRAAPRRSGDAWIRLLGHRERALREAFQGAIAMASAPDAQLLSRQLPRLHSIHLDMDILAGVSRW